MPLISTWRFRIISSTGCRQKLRHQGMCVTLLNVLLFPRWVKQESELSKQAQAPDSTPKLDLGFKEGQTITLNIGVNCAVRRAKGCS